MKFVIPIILLIALFIPLSGAMDLGDFKWEDGKITGRYMPAGLEGKISCFSNGRHILDVIYQKDSIELSIQYFDALQQIIEKNPFLKKEIEESLLNLTLSGAAFTVDYEGCVIELHDTPTRFLRVIADKIVITDFSYNVSRVDDNTIRLNKENFSATLLSEQPIGYNNENITAYGQIMLVSFSFEEEKRIEDAFKNKTIGGEVTIAAYDEEKVDCISYFGNVKITPATLEKGKIVLNIKGDEKSGGKIIKINLGKSVCISDDLTIKFDGIKVEKASSFEDILNPDDDGIQPEYYVLSSEEGKFILVTVPHFSEHQLSIEFLMENIFAKLAAIVMGLLVILFATFYMFKK